jgi:hypothetical protein
MPAWAWGLLALVVAFVVFMAVGRWLIAKGRTIEEHHHPEAEDSVERFTREQAGSHDPRA